MCTKKHLLNIKGISEAKVDKIKEGAHKLLDVGIQFNSNVHVCINPGIPWALQVQSVPIMFHTKKASLSL